MEIPQVSTRETEVSSQRFGGYTRPELESACSRPPPCIDTLPALFCRCPSGPVHLAPPSHISECLCASVADAAAAVEEVFATPSQQLVAIDRDHGSGPAHFESDAIQARVVAARRSTRGSAGTSCSPVSGVVSCLSRPSHLPRALGSAAPISATSVG